MTVSNQTTKCIYQGNGVNRTWDITFPADSPEHISVWLTSPGGTEMRVEAGFLLDTENHCVIYPTEESALELLPEGWKITLLRHTPLTQEVRLLRHGELDAEVLERAYDKTVMMVQELDEKLARAVLVPLSDEETSGAATFLLEIRTLCEEAKALRREIRELAELTKALACSAEDEAVPGALTDLLEGGI